jgi:arsenite-transporting ATPase
VPELSFFIGKGGVGKTTVAASYAVKTAKQLKGSRVLLVSTDPAHSLGDVLGQKLGVNPKHVRIQGRGKLSAWELQAAPLFQNFLRQYKRNILEIVERGSLFSAEDIAPLLDSSLPGMAEMAGLLAIDEALNSRKYSHIVVDTAPFGHTLRLFNLPEQFEKLLNFLELASERDQVLAQHLGGASTRREPGVLDDWREKLRKLTQSFSAARLFLVTTAEKFALNESLRCAKEVANADAGLKVSSVILNRVVRRATKCEVCRARYKAQRAAEAFLRRNFGRKPLRYGEDPGSPILGMDALARFGRHVFDGKPLRLQPQHHRKGAALRLAITHTKWPDLKSQLSFVLGKGGVGKTTVSAALGFHCRMHSKAPVEICSVDPAPSLDDIFQTAVGDTPVAVLGDQQFCASELDSVALFKAWVAEIRDEISAATTSENSGVHIDLSFERELLSALLDIVPPGLDEVLAIFRISDMGAIGSSKVIIDMAPTGHALELLAMPERIVGWSRLLLKSLATHRKLALARNVALRIAELEMRARELSKTLSDRQRAHVFAVMLAEPLPDRETGRLLSQLTSLGIKPRALFVNRVISAKDVEHCARCRNAAAWQESVLAKLSRSRAVEEIFVIREFSEEIAGKAGLRAMTRELWRVN